jgi:caa(3)-type oxidase subunit IV
MTAQAHASHDRKTYYKVFVWLFVLTIVEVLVPMWADKYGDRQTLLASFMPHWSTSALFVLSAAKAAIVGLFFMHLKFETKWLKFIAVMPAIAIFYAFSLGAEAFFRFGPHA